MNGVTCSGVLRVDSGSLTLTNVSEISGMLFLAPNTAFVAQGAAALCSLSGEVCIDGASLLSTSGGTIEAPDATFILSREHWK